MCVAHTGRFNGHYPTTALSSAYLVERAVVDSKPTCINELLSVAERSICGLRLMTVGRGTSLSDVLSDCNIGCHILVNLQQGSVRFRHDD